MEYIYYFAQIYLIKNSWKNPLAPPRRSPPRTAACLAEKFSLHFLFCARRFFYFKRKRKFFCFGFRAQNAEQRGFASARGQKLGELEREEIFARSRKILFSATKKQNKQKTTEN